jgi:hypothetical protein
VRVEKILSSYQSAMRFVQYSGPRRAVIVEAIIVGADRLPHVIRVKCSVGYGPDEEAIRGVAKWGFKPGTMDGHPVDVQINVDVTFRLY